jgi:hypothetical protein
VTQNGENGAKEKAGSKRKSKGDKDTDDQKSKKVAKKADQRVFITKTDDTVLETVKKTVKGAKKAKVVPGKKTRPSSPKFFVTLDGTKKKGDEAAVVKPVVKPQSPAIQNDTLIIHTNNSSDESDDDTSSKALFDNKIAKDEATKIKEIQRKNPLPPIVRGIQDCMKIITLEQVELN